ncbi:MAG: DEAD/DEAH box helicase family protein, partial [Candidatus Eisenbacteria bacterium]|nr:DEAD/DEAH box helicase family protein [Candidatus Eisenbacteria bacterium]
MKTDSLEFARELIEFAPTSQTQSMGFGRSQLDGAVTAYNMIARNHVAYLADEVGMGKTYVALGVLGLLRHQNPHAHVVVIAPRRNIQEKWIKELKNFVRQNWKVTDNCVRSLDGTPVYDPVFCERLEVLADVAWKSHHRDLFLRSTSFSASVADADSRRRIRNRIRPQLPESLPRNLLSAKNPYEFRDAYGRAINALLPDIDLLIVDEAHNLRHGFDPKGSNRNRVLGMSLGHPEEIDPEAYPWYRRRVRNLLLLSATPFECDYADVYRQLDVLGAGGTRLVNARGEDPILVSRLTDREANEEEKRALLARFLIRRVAHLNIGGDKHSKNMYRREWRAGGYAAPTERMEISDPKQRLVVGLIQKKVAEVLQGGRFQNSFQIGMLSSFESFLESMGSRGKKGRPDSDVVADPGVDPISDDLEADADSERQFEGEQIATSDERRGIDRISLATVVDSYRETFGRPLPHPKLEATADALCGVFETGEKALIFVRRVATVTELKVRLDLAFDAWIERRMKDALPALAKEVDGIFARYREEKRGSGRGAGVGVGTFAATDGGVGSSAVDSFAAEDADSTADDSQPDWMSTLDDRGWEEDEGDTDSFFGWFFRGRGPDGILSGAAFQKNRLASMASVYSTLFEDDHVAWLLGRPEDPIAELADVLGLDVPALESRLRASAYGYFRKRSRQKEGYPRFYIVEAYQVAALELLAASGHPKYEHDAKVLLYERYRVSAEESLDVPPRFPGPREGIGIVTFFTELVKRPQLRQALWPDPETSDFRARYREREQRRELLGAMARLGATYIDLYLIAIRLIGSFGARVEMQADRPEAELTCELLDLLEAQRDQGTGFHAYAELSNAAAAFESIVQVNFPDAPQKPLPELAKLYGQTLQHQVPVARMEGRVNPRVVRQFRMPGFPLVLATTDVLQEGEDLHTFCRRVIHYGIAWTPSAMEQRTGRVDRIGSLVQRALDGRDDPADGEELIQVYYPHLVDTVEVLQVRKVLERLNQFLRLIHQTKVGETPQESRISIDQEALRGLDVVPQFQGLLESAFPVRDEWTLGEVGTDAVRRLDVASLESLFAAQWKRFRERWRVTELRSATGRSRTGTVYLRRGRCVPAMDAEGRAVPSSARRLVQDSGVG